jgi:hypothetical protein
MFCVTEAEAAAICTAFDREGELSAAIELRRLFPGVTDNAQARSFVRMIAGWKPLPEASCSTSRDEAAPPSRHVGPANRSRARSPRRIP